MSQALTLVDDRREAAPRSMPRSTNTVILALVVALRDLELCRAEVRCRLP